MSFAIGLILSSLKMFGWQRLLRLTWKVVYPDLLKYARRTETQIDENGLEAVNELLGQAASKTSQK